MKFKLLKASSICRLFAALFLLGIILPVYAAAQQINPEVIINGNPLPPSAVLGSTGTDLAVKATPFFSCAGGVVKVTGNKLEASWMQTTLIITAGQYECTYNGQSIALQTPSGMYENDLVVQLKEFCSIIGATSEEQGNKIIVWKQTNSSPANTALSTSPVPMGSPKSSFLNSFAAGNIPGTLPGSISSPDMAGSMNGASYQAPYDPSAQQGGYAPAVNSRAFPEAGMGGLSSKNAEISSPYERPNVSISSMGSYSYTVETPRTPDQISQYRSQNIDNTPLENLYTLPGGGYNPHQVQQNQQPHSYVSYSQPAAMELPTSYSSKSGKMYQPKPAKPAITLFEVERQMSFHLTAYQVKLKVRNDGELPFTKPFMVKLTAKDSRADDRSWDLLESYSIEPLQPGQEVEIVKKVDGHQFQCMMATSIMFKALVLEDAPIVKDRYYERNWQTAKSRQKEKERLKTQTPKVRVTCTAEREIFY